MSNDPHLSRFMSYLSLFTFFMLILITADNYIQMFVSKKRKRAKPKIDLNSQF